MGLTQGNGSSGCGRRGRKQAYLNPDDLSEWHVSDEHDQVEVNTRRRRLHAVSITVELLRTDSEVECCLFRLESEGVAERAYAPSASRHLDMRDYVHFVSRSSNAVLDKQSQR